MRIVITALWLAGSAALAQPAADRDDRRWVCVPTEERQWRCGRGAQAPEPAPVPPAAPPRAAPEGYRPPADRARLPDYLRQPESGAANAPEDAATPSPGTDDRQSPAPRPEAGPGPGTGDTGAAPVPETASGPTPETQSEPESSGPEIPPGPSEASARYGIQLVAGRDRESVEALRERPGLQSLDVYRRTWEDAGGVWHVLLAGRFETVAAARRALNQLPGEFRRAGAWIRPLDGLDNPSDQPREPQSD